jgi:methanogenic corrinoid protein MtbC1/DNA-binding XRE family transcriptional regulator
MKTPNKMMDTLFAEYANAILSGDGAKALVVVDKGLVYGFEPVDLCLRLIAEAQVRVGNHWHSGIIGVAEEHRATQISLEAMDVLKKSMPTVERLGLAATVTTAEGEYHYLGARMVADFLYADGWDVAFLGPSTPTTELVRFVQRNEIDLVALSSTTQSQFPEMCGAAQALAELRPKPVILVGGAATVERVPDCPADLTGGDAPQAVREARRLLGIGTVPLSLEEYLEQLGRRVRRFRKGRGWSQQELGDRSNLDRAYINILEGGRQNPSIRSVKAIADALGISLADMIKDELLHDRQKEVANNGST